MQSLSPVSSNEAAPQPSMKLRLAVREILLRARFQRRVINRLKRQLGAGTVSNTLPAS
jgi:hypothetical protein